MPFLRVAHGTGRRGIVPKPFSKSTPAHGQAKAELQAVGVSVRRLEEIDRRLLKGGSEEQCNMVRWP